VGGGKQGKAKEQTRKHRRTTKEQPRKSLGGNTGKKENKTNQEKSRKRNRIIMDLKSVGRSWFWSSSCPDLLLLENN